MSYLIHINEKTNQILHPDAVKLFPGFNVLTNDEVLFIVLAYDYNSPYSAFPEEDRLRRASLHVWSDNRLEILDKQKIKNAIEAYKGLQYNSKIELSRAYQKKIDDLNSSLETTVDANQIEKILKSQKLLRASIRELEQEVLASYEEEDKLVGNATRSFLETMHKNKELYKKVIQKK
jgi:hypothetical protein